MIKGARIKAISRLAIIGVLLGVTGVFAQENIVQASSGKEFVITLESNPTTGYSWRLTERPDRSIVEFIRQRYIPPQDGLIGAGGKEEWVFKALRSGEIKVLFEYVRPWEKGTAPEKTESFLVIIK